MTSVRAVRRPDFVDLLPGATDRAAIVGQTGSGKTYLAERILAFRAYCVVYDAKGRIAWPGWEVHTRLVDLKRSESPRLIYRPTYHELVDEEKVNEFFAWVYDHESRTCYIDEIYAIAKGDNYPYYYGACLTRGREKDISIITSTQRPSRVPVVMFSESEHVYCFKLKMEQDRDRVEAMTGIDPDAIADLDKEYFYYCPQDGDISGPWRLKG